MEVCRSYSMSSRIVLGLLDALRHKKRHSREQHKLTNRQTFIVLVAFKSLLQLLSLLGRQWKPLQQAVDCLPWVSHQVKRSHRLRWLRRVLLNNAHITIGFLPVSTPIEPWWCQRGMFHSNNLGIFHLLTNSQPACRIFPAGRKILHGDLAV